jgi:Tol biopolymer transport system component
MRKFLFSITSFLIFIFACRDSGGVGPSASGQYKIAYFSDEFPAIHVVAVDGSNEIILPPFLGHGTSVDWFTDGNSLVYADAVGNQFGDTASAWLYQLSSGQKRFLFSTPMLVIQHLSISPNGQMVACRLYHYDNTGAELCVFDANGGNRRSLTAPAQFASDCSWSPDGSHIVFCLDSNICRINPDGSGFTQLTAGSGYKAGPSYSPDGTQIVYWLHYLDGSQAVCAMNADGSNSHMLTPIRYAFQGSPQWSPDGKLIAYIKDDSTHISRVFRMDTDGANVKQLSSGPGVHFLPHWLPNMEIVYLSNDTQDLWVVDKGGIQAKQVTHVPPGMGGGYVYFALSKSTSL